MANPLTLGVIGIDHDHIFGMLDNMRREGCTCKTWWSDGPAVTENAFLERYPDILRVDDRRRILDDPEIDLILIAAIPADRAGFAIEAMEAGKDVMVDKPGCTTGAQLASLRDTIARTRRIWSVNFSERFQVPAVAKAEELVANGAIGRVIQTLGIGPHRARLAERPRWFFKRARFGGILCDIASHQIDQFLWFTKAQDVEISHALVENTTRPEHSEFQDFGEIVLTGKGTHGYIRVDWFTPGALPVWGDGRLFLLGEHGHIEIRKYIDIGNGNLSNQLLLANGDRVDHIDCSDGPLPYFARLIDDIRTRGETAAPQAHTLRTMELALAAQALAEQRNHG